jgi:hypothetical protein
MSNTEATAHEETMQDAVEMSREIQEIRNNAAFTLIALKQARADLAANLPAFNGVLPGSKTKHDALQAEISRLDEQAKTLDALEIEKLKESASFLERQTQVSTIAREFDLPHEVANRIEGDTLQQMRETARKLKATLPQSVRTAQNYLFNQGVSKGGVPFPE